jgi:hypothetical protein
MNTSYGISRTLSECLTVVDSLIAIILDIPIVCGMFNINSISGVRFQVLMVVSMKMTLFWAVV